MKKLVVFLFVAFMFGSQVLFSQEKIYGSIDYTGFHAITDGYFWSKRPEAKEVFNGKFPSNVDEVKKFEADYLVKFIPGEHNSRDGNYIIFPKGEIIYKKDGRWYAARCGNEIEFWRKLNEVEIVEKTVEKIVEVPAKPAPEPEKEKPVVSRDTTYETTVVRETVYEDDVYYRPRMQMCWMIRPIMPNGGYGQPMYVDNRTYINNYRGNTNYYCKRSYQQPPVEPPHASGPGGRGDEGNHASGPGGRYDGNDTGSGSGSGPGGRADGNDNGGHASGPSGDSNGNNNSGGPGGRSALATRDNMGRITSSQVQANAGRRVNTSNNPTASMVSRNTSYSQANVNVRLANRISGGTTSYNPGVRRSSNMQAQVRLQQSNRSFNSYAPSRSSRPSGGGNGLMSGPTMGRR